MMTRLLCALALAFIAAAVPAHAERYGICEDNTTSAAECFLVKTQETYRKCRTIQSMMMIEYGFFESYLPDNNGEKLNFCIDKHRRDIVTPYQAALKEFTKHHAAQVALTELYRAWLWNLQQLIPAIVESREAYETRVSDGADELLDKVGSTQTLLLTPVVAPAKKSAATGKSKRK
jgi:hypothetical protein